MLYHFRSTRPLFPNSHSHCKIGICCKYCHIPRLPRCLCFLLPYCLCVNSPPFPWCTALHKPGLIQIHKDKKTNIQIHKHALSTTQYCLGVQHCISQDCRRRLILPDFPRGAFEVLSLLLRAASVLHITRTRRKKEAKGGVKGRQRR